MAATAPARRAAAGARTAPSKRAGKAACAAECEALEQLPNIGPAMAGDLRRLGITHPRQLAQADALALYQGLCRLSGQHQDPCVMDTFLAITDFMRGAPAAPWWHYTAQRKQRYGQLSAPGPGQPPA